MDRKSVVENDATITVSSSIFSEDDMTTREKIARIEAKLNNGECATSTRTREKLRAAEAKLAAIQPSTSTRTRERLALLEAELASKRDRTTDGRTASKTREKLAEVEKQLAMSRIQTSTKTRERLALAEAELARMNVATSTKTREKLARVEAAIKKERQKKTSSMTIEMFKKKQQLLENMMKENSNVDVAFLVDCTGSMASYINETKNDIQGIVTKITETFENRIRLAFVGYRDHSDGPSRIVDLGFTENVDEFKTFVSNIAATGGGDTPEDVLGGLESALNLTWSSKNKVIFHIGDAPQHGRRFHDLESSQDHYFDVEPRGLQIEDLLRTLKQMKIKYYFGKINASTDKMIQEFKRVGGSEVLQITDMKNPDLLEMTVADSVTATIELSLHDTVKSIRGFRGKGGLHGITEESEGEKTLKDYSISEVDPDYSSMKEENDVKWLECSIPPLLRLADIKTSIGTINHRWSTAKVTRAHDPFAEGEQRISYHGFRLVSDSNQKIVLKEFKHVGKGRDRREDYIEIMETQAVAAFMAHQFNQIAPVGSKEIQFLHVSVMQIYKSDGAPKYYNVEVLLPDYKDNFKKWNSNAGYVSDKIYSSTLDAFSHWTYDVTEGFLVVVDLQGVDRDKSYWLTDPSINCIEPRFGLTNLGNVGIKMFFKSHRCNEICQAMNLKKNRHMRPSTPARISAAVTKMVGWS